MEKTIGQAKVHFVAGKGGVGKTLISQAIAKHFAERAKTLLVILSEEETGDEHPQYSSIKKIGANLSYIKIYPDQAIYEYLSLKIPNQKMLDTFLAKRLIKALCSAMPGLSDLTRLGKIWYHADDQSEKFGEIYEKIVVDMPSSGFVERFLTIASVVSQAVKIGPLSKEAQLIHDYFKDAQHARLHVVTLLEELVVNETLELWEAIEKAHSLNLGLVFINRVLPISLNKLPYIPSEYADKAPLITKIMESFRNRIVDETTEHARLSKNGVALPHVVFTDRIGEEVESNIVDHMVEELRMARFL